MDEGRSAASSRQDISMSTEVFSMKVRRVSTAMNEVKRADSLDSFLGSMSGILRSRINSR